MSATLVAKANNRGTSTSLTTDAINTTGANLLLAVFTSYLSPDLNSISDSKGNTWHWLTTYGVNFMFTTIGYAYNPTVGPNHTLTSTSSDYKVLFFYAFSGMDTTANVFDAENGKTNQDETFNTGSVEPSVSGDLLITAGCSYLDAFETSTVDGGFVIEDLIAAEGGVNPSSGVALDLSYDSTNPVSCTWSNVAGFAYSLVIASFKIGVSSGNPMVPLIMTLYRQRGK